MTRPVADILAEAERDDWPTSSISAMAKANHHLCGNARDTDSGSSALDSELRLGGPEKGAVPVAAGPHPPYDDEPEGLRGVDRGRTEEAASGSGAEGVAR